MALTYKTKAPQKGGGFTVPPGNYKFIVLDAKEETSKSGNDMVKLTLRIIKEDGEDGPKMFDYLVQDEFSFWKIDSFLKSCDKHPGEGEDVSINADSMIGWEGTADFKQDTYNGNTNMKVAAYTWPDF